MLEKTKTPTTKFPSQSLFSKPNHHHKHKPPATLEITNKTPCTLLPLSHSHSHSHSNLLLKQDSKTTSFQCNHSNGEATHQWEWEWEGLKFIKGEKPLSDLSTWGIGGPCHYFVQVFHLTQLLSALRFCREHSIRFMIIGRGSNCLFDSLGFDGCVILNRVEFLERIEPGTYRVGSGFRFNRLGILCTNEGFTGLEFAGGIPGTVGGAAYMNAGANGQETADAIYNVEIITSEGKFRALTRSDLSFGYRSSSFQDMDNLAAISAVTFQLKRSESAKKRQMDYLERRRVSQPVGERTAGSVFRNPSNLGVSAAELIDRAGLKGLRVGGAMVSNKHANFFINSGGSTSQDMLELVALVKETVYQKFGVELKEEIVYYPYT